MTNNAARVFFLLILLLLNACTDQATLKPRVSQCSQAAANFLGLPQQTKIKEASISDNGKKIHIRFESMNRVNIPEIGNAECEFDSTGEQAATIISISIDGEKLPHNTLLNIRETKK